MNQARFFWKIKDVRELLFRGEVFLGQDEDKLVSMKEIAAAIGYSIPQTYQFLKGRIRKYDIRNYNFDDGCSADEDGGLMKYDKYALRRRREQSPSFKMANELLPILSSLPADPPSSYSNGGWTRAQDIALLRAVLDVGINGAHAVMQKVRPGATRAACESRINKLRMRFINFVEITSIAHKNEQRRSMARAILAILMRQTLPPVYERSPNPWLREHDIALLQGVIELGSDRASERVKELRPSATRDLCFARLRHLAKKYGVAPKRTSVTGTVKWFD